jgi:hypothetical protein
MNIQAMYLLGSDSVILQVETFQKHFLPPSSV